MQRSLCSAKNCTKKTVSFLHNFNGVASIDATPKLSTRSEHEQP